MSPLRPTTLDKIPKAGNYPGRQTLDRLLEPLLLPIAQRYSSNTVQRLMGFWVLWHSFGDLSRLVDSGFMPRRTAYANRADFLKVFGVNVEDFAPDAAKQIREGFAFRAAEKPAEAASE